MIINLVKQKPNSPYKECNVNNISGAQTLELTIVLCQFSKSKQKIEMDAHGYKNNQSQFDIYLKLRVV